MSHFRVIPRDFFNEAKLLKCLGFLQLYIMDRNEIGLVSEFDGNEPFKIVQDSSDGLIFVSNYHVSLNSHTIHLFTPLNAREKFPLIGRYKGEDYYIFSEKGRFMPDFGVQNATHKNS